MKPALTGIIVGLCLCGSAEAQWSPDASAGLGAGYGDIAMSQSILTGTGMLGGGESSASSGGLSPHMQRYCAKHPQETVCRRNAARSGASNNVIDMSAAFRPGGAAPVAASSAFEYRSSSAVSATLRQQLADRLAQDNPAQARNIRNALATDAIWKDFSRLLSSFGYSASNVADVMTGYYVINWEVVNGADASRNSAGIQAARKQFAAALASNAQFSQMADADKQRLAESMGYMAAIAGAGKNEMLRSGNRKGLIELQTAIHQSVMQAYGVDLTRLKLSSNGFVRS